MNDFWSRRKAAVSKEAAAELEEQQAALRAEEEQRLAERTDQEILAELNLPEPEMLEDAGQVREFLNSAIPQRLKTRALRRLWRLNPVLANLDGLVDYGEDFTDSTRVIENLQTAYVVGKGMLARFEDVLTPESTDPEPTPEPEASEATSPLVADQPPEEPAPVAAAPVQETAQADIDLETYEPVAPRRMRFRFEQIQEA